MRKFILLVVVCSLCGGVSQAVLVNGATANLEMRTTLTLSNGAQMTFFQGHGANGAYGYTYTDVGGLVEEDEDGENGWNDWMSYSASTNTSHGQSGGSVFVNTAGFDYSISADAMVQGLAVGDYGKGLGYAYAWPDWLQCTAAGTATVQIDYIYTVDATDSIADAEAHIFMNAFFADHQRTNYLWAQGNWVLGPPNANGTTTVDYMVQVAAGQVATLSDSVSWSINIPNTSEPYSWWSMWSYGEAEVEVAPVPEPATICLLGLGVFGLLCRRPK